MIDAASLGPKFWIREELQRGAKKVPFSDVYYSEMKPVLITLRLLARLPYEMSEKGEMVVKVNSKWTLYSLIMYSVQTYFVYMNIVGVAGILMNPDVDLDRKLFTSISLTFMVSHALVPLLFWREWPLVVRYFNQWRRLQEQCSKDIDSPVGGGHRLAVLVGVVVSVPSAIGLGVLLSVVLSAFSLWSLLAYVVVTLHGHLYLIFWVFTCLKLANTGCQARNEVLETEPHIRAKRLCRLRYIWLGLSCLVQDLGSATSSVMICITTTIIYCFVASSYGLLSLVTSRPMETFGYSTVLITSVLYLGSMIESAHRTSYKVGQLFFTEMLLRDTSILDHKSTYEVDLFLQAVSMNRPTIKLGDFVTINRHTCVSIITTTITYLIVLVQFKTSGKK